MDFRVLFQFSGMTLKSKILNSLCARVTLHIVLVYCNKKLFLSVSFVIYSLNV